MVILRPSTDKTAQEPKDKNVFVKNLTSAVLGVLTLWFVFFLVGFIVEFPLGLFGQ